MQLNSWIRFRPAAAADVPHALRCAALRAQAMVVAQQQ
jgi:hypothetical protein